MREDEK